MCLRSISMSDFSIAHAVYFAFLLYSEERNSTALPDFRL